MTCGGRSCVREKALRARGDRARTEPAMRTRGRDAWGDSLDDDGPSVEPAGLVGHSMA